MNEHQSFIIETPISLEDGKKTTNTKEQPTYCYQNDQNGIWDEWIPSLGQLYTTNYKSI